MRQNISSNSPFEALAGYSRAVRVDNHVFVAGTGAWSPDGKLLEGGAYEQAAQCLRNIEAALLQAGATMSDVVRTRMYVIDIDTMEGVSRAHREAFADVMPAATLVEVSRLATPEMQVEIEADAVIEA